MAPFGAPGLRFAPVEACRLTIWIYAGLWLGLVAYAVAWIWGGRPERFAAGVMILNCLLSFLTYKWVVGGLHLASFAENCVRLLIFLWLLHRSDRWWPFIVVGAMLLSVLVYVLALLDPAFSETQAFSAQVGLGYLIDLILMLSVFERRLAGERPAGSSRWAAANIATSARRRRKPEDGSAAPASTAASRRKGMTNRAPAC